MIRERSAKVGRPGDPWHPASAPLWDAACGEASLPLQNHVVLRLVCDAPLPESNTSNNYAISLTPFVNIPEWDLALNTSGNGAINQDFAALSYAHNSRVSLAAKAGKGVSFAGWSGDALGAESEITVLMNGDKSVMATSSNGILQPRLEPGYLSIIFTRVSGADSGYTLQSQGTRTLSGWDAPDFQERILSTDLGIETVEARLPTTDQQRGFIRMRYQR